jgi:hypothetical protein
MKYAALNDAFSGKISAIGKLCGLKKILIIDFGAAIVCFTLRGSSLSTAIQMPDLSVFQRIHDSSPVQNKFQLRLRAVRSSARTLFAPSTRATF